jgi:exosortase
MTTTSAANFPAFQMRNFLAVVGILGLVAAAYWPSTSTLAAYWTDPDMEMQHGLLVGLLSVWMLYRRRGLLGEAPLRPSLWAAPLLLAASLASLIFWRAGIQSLQLLLLPAIVLLALVTALGVPVARQAALPLGYLYLAMPGWGYLGPALQDLTARAVSVLLPLVGVPVQVTGHLVALPHVGTFEVTPACSGVNFLVVALAVAALLGELEWGSLPRRAWLLVLAGLVAILSNWARVALIIAIGSATNMRHVWATRDHLLFGWVVFALVLLGFAWLAPRDPDPQRDPVSRRDPAPPRRDGSQAVPLKLRVRALAAAAAALLAVPLWVYALAARAAPDAAPARLPIEPAPAEWRGPLAAAGNLWQPTFVGVHSEGHFLYEGPDGRSVEVMTIGYSRQAQGRELVNEGNSLFGNRGLVSLDTGMAVVDGRSYRELLVTDPGGRRSIVWSLYDIGGRTFATALRSQLWYGIHSFVHPPYSALDAFRAGCEPSCDAARGTLRTFLRRWARSRYEQE